VLRKDRVPHPIIVAATHRYPNREDVNKCKEFAALLRAVYEGNPNYKKLW